MTLRLNQSPNEFAPLALSARTENKKHAHIADAATHNTIAVRIDISYVGWMEGVRRTVPERFAVMRSNARRCVAMSASRSVNVEICGVGVGGVDVGDPATRIAKNIIRCTIHCDAIQIGGAKQKGAKQRRAHQCVTEMVYR